MKRFKNKFIPDWTELKIMIMAYKELGKRIVFTNGCFDILHVGHVRCLEQARILGDILVVGLNSDQSIRNLKGDRRPINSLDDRAGVLCGLECVDFITQFTQSTPIELLKVVLPDIYVKGGDYKRVDLLETSIVESIGGMVKVIPYISGRSTSNIIQKVLRVYGN